MSPSKGANSDNTTTNNPPMGHNRSSRRNTPNHKYRVRVDRSGRITLKNRRFLRKLETPTTLTPITSAAPKTSTLNPIPAPLKPNIPEVQTMNTGITSNTAQPSTMTQTKTPQGLSRLLPRNQPGIKELISPKVHYPRVMRGKEM